jgi:hypothetical protein
MSFKLRRNTRHLFLSRFDITTVKRTKARLNWSKTLTATFFPDYVGENFSLL